MQKMSSEIRKMQKMSSEDSVDAENEFGDLRFGKRRRGVRPATPPLIDYLQHDQAL